MDSPRNSISYNNFCSHKKERRSLLILFKNNWEVKTLIYYTFSGDLPANLLLTASITDGSMENVTLADTQSWLLVKNTFSRSTKDCRLQCLPPLHMICVGITGLLILSHLTIVNAF